MLFIALINTSCKYDEVHSDNENLRLQILSLKKQSKEQSNQYEELNDKYIKINDEYEKIITEYQETIKKDTAKNSTFNKKTNTTSKPTSNNNISNKNEDADNTGVKEDNTDNKSNENDSENRIYSGKYKITYYCPCYSCSGGYGTQTASGATATQGITVAADTSILKMGTRIYIDGIGYRTVQDVGGAVKGKVIDIFVNSCKSSSMPYNAQKLDVWVIME